MNHIAFKIIGWSILIVGFFGPYVYIAVQQEYDFLSIIGLLFMISLVYSFAIKLIYYKK